MWNYFDVDLPDNSRVGIKTVSEAIGVDVSNVNIPLKAVKY